MGHKYGSTVYLVNEYLTTKTCSNCGALKEMGSEEIYKCDKCKTKLLYNDERISDDLLQKVFNKCPTRLCEHCNQTGKHLIFKSCDNCDGTGGTTTKKCFKCKGEKSIVVGQTNVDCDKCW